ncbi:MAG: PTS sugar transporter [Isosphaeraceae bacterium]
MPSKAERIAAGLGGIDNILSSEGDGTRLRVEIVNPELVKDVDLKAAGAHGVVKMGTDIQVIVGTEANAIATQIQNMK